MSLLQRFNKPVKCSTFFKNPSIFSIDAVPELQEIFLQWSTKNYQNEQILKTLGRQYLVNVECESKNYKEFTLSNFFDKLSEDFDGNSLYLKDWHLQSLIGQTYKCPQIFQPDWLNEFCLDNGLDDYRFFYLGTKDSSTSRHVDVLSSYSWSFSLQGRKKFTFYGKQNEILSGEAIFVPSNIEHSVLNLDHPTCSLNHNWINETNIQCVVNLLKSSLSFARRTSSWDDNEIDHEVCQKIIKCSEGMDFESLCDMLIHIIGKRCRENNLSESKVAADVLIAIKNDPDNLLKGTNFYLDEQAWSALENVEHFNCNEILDFI